MNKQIFGLWLILLSAAAFSQSITDTTFSIRPVTVSAERIFDKEDAGVKTSKVDSLVIIEKINLSLSDLLSENTPIFIKSHGRGALASASFRGTASSHTQVNWNGININSPMTGMVDFSLIPVYIIDDMSIKYGSASMEEQSGGLGGSININNKVDWNQTFSAKYMQGIGSYKTFDEFLSLGGGSKKWQFKTRLYHNYSKNDYTFINRGIPIINPQTGEITHPLDTNDHADYQKYGGLQEVYFRPNGRNVFSVKYWGQKADRTIPRATSYEGPDNANLNKLTDQDHKAVGDWKHYFANAKLTVRSGYTQKDLLYTLKNQVPGQGLISAIYSESQQQSSLNNVSYRHQLPHQIAIEGRIDFNYHNVSSKDTVSKTGYQQERTELLSFLAIRKNFQDRVNLNLRLRQNIVDGKALPFIPFWGFDYRVFKDVDFLIKGNIARNYHQPSLNDLYWQPGGNPNLKAEKGLSYELGLEYQKNIGNHLLKTELTAYRSDIDDWIIWIPTHKGYWQARNIKRVLSQGIEWHLSLRGKWRNWTYQLSGNYAYTSSVNYGEPLVWGDESYGKQLVYVPLHSGNLLVNINYKGYYISYQHNSYSERFTTSNNNVSRRDWLYPYFMNDLILGKDLKIKKIKLSAEFKIYNLFNETYHSVLYRPMPRRNYMLVLAIRF